MEWACCIVVDKTFSNGITSIKGIVPPKIKIHSVAARSNTIEVNGQKTTEKNPTRLHAARVVSGKCHKPQRSNLN